MLCNKGCGWNLTHTSGFHKQFLATPSAFPAALPDTHPFKILVAKSNGSSPVPPPPPTPPTQLPASLTNSSSGTGASSLTLTENQMVIDKSKWKSVLDYHERTSENAEVAALCTSLKELLK